MGESYPYCGEMTSSKMDTFLDNELSPFAIKKS